MRGARDGSPKKASQALLWSKTLPSTSAAGSMFIQPHSGESNQPVSVHRWLPARPQQTILSLLCNKPRTGLGSLQKGQEAFGEKHYTKMGKGKEGGNDGLFWSFPRGWNPHRFKFQKAHWIRSSTVELPYRSTDMTETARETWEPSALLVLANGLCRIDLFSPSFMGEILFFFFFSGSIFPWRCFRSKYDYHSPWLMLDLVWFSTESPTIFFICFSLNVRDLPTTKQQPFRVILQPVQVHSCSNLNGLDFSPSFCPHVRSCLFLTWKQRVRHLLSVITTRFLPGDFENN